MAFNVSEFRSQMQFDGARANLFDVEMNFPSFALPGNASKKMQFQCKSAQLPGTTVNAVPVQYFGREVKFAGNRTFADWTVNIINDEDFSVRNAFERWLNGVNSHRTNVRAAAAGGPTSYGVDAVVKHYGKTGKVLKSYKFIGLFPVDVSPIDLDWGNNDTIEEYTVTFSYQWWEAVAEGVF
jgi:hypothetical protein